MLRIGFRTDASLQIGIGHVMRCLTLADTLHERGAACRFICRPHPGNLIEQIRQRGHEAIVLPATAATVAETTREDTASSSAHAAWLGTDWETDAQDTTVALDGIPVDWLIVDHYALDARWERSLRPACRQLMVIDDLADRPHDCDLLLDQNLGTSAADYAALVPDGCTILAGTRHALLRPEFAALRPYSLARRQDPQLRRLLITMGGVDKDDVTGVVLDAMRVCPLPADCRITVVMGPHAPCLGQVRQRAARMPRPTEVQVNVHDMARLMADSDLAIGAAGSTSWERCCLGLPSIQMVLAENQKDIADVLRRVRAALPADAESLTEVLAGIFSADGALGQRMKALSRAAAAITDGRGAELVASKLKNGFLS